MAAREEARSAPTRPIDVPVPQPSAPLLGTGLVLLVVGLVLWQVGTDPITPLLGLLTIAGGAITLASGVFRAARNLDSMAAVAYNQSLRHDG